MRFIFLDVLDAMVLDLQNIPRNLSRKLMKTSLVDERWIIFPIEKQILFGLIISISIHSSKVFGVHWQTLAFTCNLGVFLHWSKSLCVSTDFFSRKAGRCIPAQEGAWSCQKDTQRRAWPYSIRWQQHKSIATTKLWLLLSESTLWHRPWSLTASLTSFRSCYSASPGKLAPR